MSSLGLPGGYDFQWLPNSAIYGCEVVCRLPGSEIDNPAVLPPI
jgi:hypothetical protein